MNSIQTAYINALLADASYVVAVQSGAVASGKFGTRLTPAQATFLSENFTVKATTVPTSEGFNAVVWEGKTDTEYAGQVFVSMRGTQEVQDFVDDVQLAAKGIPYKQIAEMVNWWMRETGAAGSSVKQIAAFESATLSTFIAAPTATGTGHLQGLDPIAFVNGHSLGGYLSTAFTRIFGSAFAVGQINTFNSAGFSNVAYFNIGGEYNNIANLLGSAMGMPFDSVGAKQTNYVGQNGVNFTTNSLGDMNRPGFNQYGQRIGLHLEDGYRAAQPLHGQVHRHADWWGGVAGAEVASTTLLH